MKKSAFVNLMVGTVSGLLFSLGMCMCLLPEWNAFKPGVGCTAVGWILRYDKACTQECSFSCRLLQIIP